MYKFEKLSDSKFEKLNVEFDEAHSLEKNGELDTAIYLYRELINRGLDTPGVFYRLALAQKKAKKTDDYQTTVMWFFNYFGDDPAVKTSRPWFVKQRDSFTASAPASDKPAGFFARLFGK